MQISLNKDYIIGYDDAKKGKPYAGPCCHQERKYWYRKGYDDGKTDLEVNNHNKREKERVENYEQSKEGLCCGTIERITATKES